MELELSLLYFAIITFTILCLFTLVVLAKRKMLLIGFIPIAASLIVSLLLPYTSILGYPTSKKLPEEFYVYQFIADEPDEAIYLWVGTRDVREPVSYVIPYTKELHDQLGSMQKAVENDDSMMIKGKRKLDDDAYDIELSFYEFVEQIKFDK